MMALNNGEKWITSAGRVSDFDMKDTECNCGCKTNNVRQGLVDILQKIADYLGVHLKLNCVCRCEKENAKVGGQPHSLHMEGMAADIAIMDVDTGNDLMSEALFLCLNVENLDIPCIIEYPGHYFCHVDIRDNHIRLYRNDKGEYVRK